MAMTRGAKWFFTTAMLGLAFFTYGRLAYQEPLDKPRGISFAFAFTNTDTQSPWERLQARQNTCIEALIYRSVPRREDGDAVYFEDTCMGDRVLLLEKSGAILNPQQNAVSKAMKDYNEQKRYYYIAAFFAALSLIPWLYGKAMRFWGRWGKPLTRLYYKLYDVLKKMSS
jgi:hypothetical protein